MHHQPLGRVERDGVSFLDSTHPSAEFWADESAPGIRAVDVQPQVKRLANIADLVKAVKGTSARRAQSCAHLETSKSHAIIKTNHHKCSVLASPTPHFVSIISHNFLIACRTHSSPKGKKSKFPHYADSLFIRRTICCLPHYLLSLTQKLFPFSSPLR